jgi:hypothetical protein
MSTVSTTVLLRILAVLIGLRGLDDILKSQSAERGLVFFGEQLAGTANAVLGPALGVFMLVYALGIWQMRRFAIPMGIAYALFSALNMALFPLRTGLPDGAIYAPGYAIYVVIGLTITAGVPWLLWRSKDSLR